MSWACPEREGTPEAAAWGARNRVVLYPGKVQTWVLARAVDRDVPSDAELKKMARAVIARWFSETPVLDIATRSGNADEISVGNPQASPIRLRTEVQRWTDLPGPLPLLKPGRVMYVPVTFVWRSQSELDRPWPTWRVRWGMGGACPTDADWMLIDVGSAQAELPNATPERSFPEEIGEKLSEAITPSPWISLGLVLLGSGYLLHALRR